MKGFLILLIAFGLNSYNLLGQGLSNDNAPTPVAEGLTGSGAGGTQYPLTPLIGSGLDDDPAGFVWLKPVTISPLSYASMDAETAKLYRNTRYHVLKVYPYAREALVHLAELDSVAGLNQKKKQTRNFRQDLEKQLKDDFKADLKNLTKTQVKILISMLERQTDRPFYDLLKDLKSGFVATFWQGLGKTYGYNLKDGYDPDQDPILEMILSDLEWPDYRGVQTVVP